MKLKYHNVTFSISLAVLLLGVVVSANAQDSKQKKEIRITIYQDGKIKTDTSFEVNRDIQKDELDAMIDEFQARPGQEFDFPHRKFNDEAFMFPFDRMPDLSMSRNLDSLFRNIPHHDGFSMNFDNDSVFEKHFGLNNRGDSVFTYKRGGKPGKTWEYRWNWQSAPCPCPKDSNKSMNQGKPDEDYAEMGPMEDEIILEIPENTDSPESDVLGTSGASRTSNYRTIDL